MTHKGPVDAPEASPTWLWYPIKVLKHFNSNGWLYLATHHLICHDERVPKIRAFAWILDDEARWSSPHVTHKGPVDAPRSLSHLDVVPKQGLETLQQQWMALLVANHLICHDERYPKTDICLDFG